MGITGRPSLNPELGLQVLGNIMHWDDARAREEFAWLRLMARFKYDGYRDFLAGVRFIESLVTWLQQFEHEERETAYIFIKRRLIYIGPLEVQRLVENFYHRTVEKRLLKCVAASMGIKPYEVWANIAACEEFDRLKRRTLFMALSDGARLDVLRHANVGVLSNEQFVVATQIDDEKWGDLLKDLRADLDDPNATFALIYLIDDFMGTGTSFLRFDAEKNEWKGKLIRFGKSIQGSQALAVDGELCVHHHIAADLGAAKVAESEASARAWYAQQGIDWLPPVHFTYGLRLGPDVPIYSDPTGNAAMMALTSKYYDPGIQTRHTNVGGVPHLGLGYGGCALPLVLEHNTPNNSIALLWAETDGTNINGIKQHPAMRPLFRRRQRHT